MKLKAFQTLLANGDDIPTLSETESRELRDEFWPLWEAALKSGEYAQCTGQLQTGFGYCCLGVAADILNPAGWRKTSHGVEWGGDNNTGGLPSTLWRVLGLPVTQDALTERNDDLKHTFKQIAAYIRENMKP